MEISRDELYRRVWETPMVVLAKEFDISDVGLSKACRGSEIPVPPRGYWMKLQHGKKVVKPPLPVSKISKVVLEPSEHRPKVSEVRRALQLPGAPRVKVELSSNGSRLCQLAQATKTRLLGLKSSGELVLASGPEYFSCRVSRSSVDQACLILDAIERAAPHFEGELKPGKDSLEFFHQNQSVVFRLTEQYTTAEVRLPGKRYETWERPDIVYSFSGKFTLEILSYFGGRKKWADGKRQRLADLLNDFMLGLVEAALAIRQQKIESEERQRRWREEAERRAERERRERDLLDFRSKLLQEIAARQERDTLRKYLIELRLELSTFIGPLPESALQWLATADAVASTQDPLFARLRRLTSGLPSGYYSSSFGKPVA